MAHGDNPADRYNHRAPRERDRERPTGHDDQSIQGKVRGEDDPETRRPRNVADARNYRAGGGGAPDDSAGAPGGTLGTTNRTREQDQ